ncbi:MAG: hypothetical protein HYS21_02560 [Deltaproteobacteria bacterium]|nr:hypothetical protein [Deltaproteobacteria bacterium]
MQIRATIIGCEKREIETKRGNQFLTELFIIDTDNNKNMYIGQILDKKTFYSYKETEVVNFTVIGISERNRKLYLSIVPQDKVAG